MLSQNNLLFSVLDLVQAARLGCPTFPACSGPRSHPKQQVLPGIPLRFIAPTPTHRAPVLFAVALLVHPAAMCNLGSGMFICFHVPSFMVLCNSPPTKTASSWYTKQPVKIVKRPLAEPLTVEWAMLVYMAIKRLQRYFTML